MSCKIFDKADQTTSPLHEINDYPAEGQLPSKWCESLRWETQDGGL